MKFFIFLLVFPFFINAQTAFISGNDTICDNGSAAIVQIDFNGVPPFTFLYAIDGITQPPIPSTNISKVILETKTAGTYTLVSYSDANSFGTFSGSAIVSVLESPIAKIYLPSDTLSIISPIANFISQSEGSIISWNWDFGDNTINDSIFNPSHIFKDSAAVYSVSLIVMDKSGCTDTATHNIWIKNEFWMYIPDSFSPDFDGINDKFCFAFNGIRENTFLFNVLNSQGDIMFQSNRPQDLQCSKGGGWDGKHFTNGIDLPIDTYLYEIYFQDFEGWKHQEYGTISLIR